MCYRECLLNRMNDWMKIVDLDEKGWILVEISSFDIIYSIVIELDIIS